MVIEINLVSIKLKPNQNKTAAVYVLLLGTLISSINSK